MIVYLVQMVGQPQHEQPVRLVELGVALPHYAVAEVAGCNWEDVGLPIWRRAPHFDGTWEVECYMPRDNTGRQWLVRRGGAQK